MLSIKLSQTAEYAIRAMSCLSLAAKNQVISSDELSQTANIPQHYLSKIMKQLVDAKLVESIKGHGGGFKISRPLKEIRFIDILSACSYGHEPDKCVFGDIKCSARKPCVLHNTWTDLNNDFKNWSTKQTLWHVRKEGEKLNKLLNKNVAQHE